MVVGTQSVDIALGEPVLMGVADKVSIVAHQSAIVAAHPDTSLSILAETGNDITGKTICHGEAVEAFPYRRDIFHSSIKCAYPHASFGVVGDGIDKAVVKLLPFSRLWIKVDQSIVATNA